MIPNGMLKSSSRIIAASGRTFESITELVGRYRVEYHLGTIWPKMQIESI